MRARHSQRRGVINIWVALCLFMMIGLVGLACDAGYSVLVLSQLQAAADSAALAGAAQVQSGADAARTAAHDLAYANRAAGHNVQLNLNDANSPGGDIVLGRYDRNARTFTPDIANPNAVKVVANRTSTGIDGRVPLVFGPAFGVNTISLSREAIAMTAVELGAAMIVLDPAGPCSLDVQGGPTLTVSGGNIQVNSTSTTAVCNGGSSGVAQISAPNLNVTGDTNVITTNAPVHTGVPPVPDPLAGLEPPPNGPTQSSPGGSGPAIIQPGYYPQGIRRTGGRLTMLPGIYVIDNAQRGFRVSGNASFTGIGVMIYVRQGSLDFSGGGVFILSPMTEGTYKDVTIFQARDNFAQSFIRGGNNLSSITGTLYFPNNLVVLNGSGGTLGNQIIAWRVRLGGNSGMNVPYTGAFPIGPNKVFLVD